MPQSFSSILFVRRALQYFFTPLYPVQIFMLAEVASYFCYLRKIIFTKYSQHEMSAQFIAKIQCQLLRQPTFDVRCFCWSYIQHLLLSEMNVAEIYGSTTGSPLQMIYICQYRGKSQHSLSDNPDFNNISMENYK